MSATSHKPLEEIPEKYINPLAPKDVGEGPRTNGKEWKIKKDAFRVRSLGVRTLSTWEQREEKRLQQEQFKQRIKDLKQEKQDEKDEKVAIIKNRRAAIAEKERYQKLAQKMHKKKLERMKKKEKRNKLLRER